MPGLSQKILDALSRYEELKKSYPVNGLTHVKNSIFVDMNTLATTETMEFAELITTPDSPLRPLLYDFFKDNPQATKKFIELSTPEQFIFYVDLICNHSYQRYRWHYHQEDWTYMLKQVFELELQYPTKNLTVEQLDTVLFAIASTLIKSLCYNADKNEIEPELLNKIIDKIKANIAALQNVNIRPGLLELILDSNIILAPNVKSELIESLLKRGIHITTIAADPNEARLILPSYQSDRTDIDMEKLYNLAFKYNPGIAIKPLESKLKEVINAGNTGACRAIVAELKIQTVPLDAFKFMDIFNTGGCLREAEIRGFVTYVQLCDKDINDVLEHAAAKSPEDLFNVIKHLCFVSRYFDYEAQPTKGLMYYFAMHPEICAKSSQLLAAYINPRYNYKSTSYCTDETYFKHGASIANLFVKANTEVSPLNVAVQQNNVQFMLFVLRAINSTVKTDLHFRQQVISAICQLQQQGCDVTEIRSYAQERLNKHWRPNRWLTFENSLLLALNRKDPSKGLSLANYMPKFM